jgi:ABC-type nickel/cobalt efflux system permease component RcnA
MGGLDDGIAGLGHGAGLGLALIVAVLLGLRHATDPDHLTAVSTLVLSDERHGTRRAGRLGLAWGVGHAVTLLALGLPVVLLRGELPEVVSRLAEAAVGVLVAVLAIRLLVRWRRGYFHVHPHRHGDVVHSHPHVHEHAHTEEHQHAHPEQLGRSPLAAFGVGLVHGVGGSAGVGILLVGAVAKGTAAAAALVLFAFAAAVSMAFVSATLGTALVRPGVRRRLGSAVPLLGLAGLLCGVYYALAAI